MRTQPSALQMRTGFQIERCLHFWANSPFISSSDGFHSLLNPRTSLMIKSTDFSWLGIRTVVALESASFFVKFLYASRPLLSFSFSFVFSSHIYLSFSFNFFFISYPMHCVFWKSIFSGSPMLSAFFSCKTFRRYGQMFLHPDPDCPV